MKFRGFQIYTEKYISGEYIERTQRDYDQIARWGFNVVRAQCFWTLDVEPNINQVGVYDGRYLNHLDRHIRMAENAGLKFIVAVRVSYNDAQAPSWWGWGTAAYVCTPEGLRRYENALRYFIQWLERQNYSNLIGYNAWMFPFHQTRPTNTQRSFFYNTVLPRITQLIRQNSDKLVFISPLRQSRTELRNITEAVIEANRGRGYYGFHFYRYAGITYSGTPTRWDYDEQWQRDYIQPALDFRLQHNVPLYIVEFGVRSERQDQVDLLNFKLSLLLEHDIDWVGYWSYCKYGGATSFCILNGDNTPKQKLVNVLMEYPPEYDPCEGVTCPQGFHCEVINGQADCIPDADPCLQVQCEPDEHCVTFWENGQWVAKCMKLDKCAEFTCKEGWHCEIGEDGLAHCVKDKVVSAAMPLGVLLAFLFIILVLGLSGRRD